MAHRTTPGLSIVVKVVSFKIILPLCDAFLMFSFGIGSVSTLSRGDYSHKGDTTASGCAKHGFKTESLAGL